MYLNGERYFVARPPRAAGQPGGTAEICERGDSRKPPKGHGCIVQSFVASRGRHTRSYGDWSSDVCSSDLKASLRFLSHRLQTDFAGARRTHSDSVPAEIGRARVGKECRSRWSPYH